MASNALGVTHGLARQVNQKSAQNMDLNTLAPALAIPAASEKLVKKNIHHVTAPVLIHGTEKRVLVRRHTNILAAVRGIPAAAVQPAVENMLLANALGDINGKMVNVRQKRHGDGAVAMLHSVHLVISCSVTERVIRIWCQEKTQ